MTKPITQTTHVVTLTMNGATVVVPYQVARNAIHEAAYAVISKVLGYPVTALQVNADCDLPAHRTLCYPEQEDYDQPGCFITEYPLLREDVRRVAGWEAENLFNFPHSDANEDWKLDRWMLVNMPVAASIAEVILKKNIGTLGVVLFELARERNISKSDLVRLLKPVQRVKARRLYDLVDADFQMGVEELKAYRKVRAELQRYKEILGGSNAE